MVWGHKTIGACPLFTIVAKALLPRGDAIALVYGTVMCNLSIALPMAMNAFGSAASDAAWPTSSRSWYVKLTDRLFWKKPV